MPLVRRGWYDADLGTGVDEEPAFGGGVVEKEELVDAGRWRRYRRSALAFPGFLAEQGGTHCLAWAP